MQDDQKDQGLLCANKSTEVVLRLFVDFESQTTWKDYAQQLQGTNLSHWDWKDVACQRLAQHLLCAVTETKKTDPTCNVFFILLIFSLKREKVWQVNCYWARIRNERIWELGQWWELTSELQRTKMLVHDWKWEVGVMCVPASSRVARTRPKRNPCRFTTCQRAGKGRTKAASVQLLPLTTKQMIQNMKMRDIMRWRNVEELRSGKEKQFDQFVRVWLNLTGFTGFTGY